MTIDFLSQRMNGMDNYLDKLEANIHGHFGKKTAQIDRKANEFDQILDTFLGENPGEVSQKALKATKAEVNKTDNFAKLPKDFEDFITKVSGEAAREYGVAVDANLVKSVIKQESGFNPTAKSTAGAQGLMQLMPATAQQVGVLDPNNPYQNVKGGVKYLSQMLQRFDNSLPKALAAYNAGPNAIEKYNGIPPYKETQNYVESIMKDYLTRENYTPVDFVG